MKTKLIGKGFEEYWAETYTCPNCGKEIMETSFCCNCGFDLKDCEFMGEK